MRAKTVRKKLAVLWVLVVVILAGVGFTVWYTYSSSQTANDVLKSANKVSSDTPKLPQVKTYADCQKSPGSKTLTTYPAQCVTTSGKMFTDDSQKYLTIKEWGVKLPLTTSIADTYYYIGPKLPSVAYFSLSSLKATDCRADDISLAAVSRVTASEVDEETGKTVVSEHPSAVKAGNYYYFLSYPQAGCNTAPAQIPQNVNLRSEFAIALSKIQPE